MCMRSKTRQTAAASSSSPVGSALPDSVLLGKVIALLPILQSCASSARRLASPPDLRSRRLPLASQLHGLLVQEHHVDLAAGSRLVGGHDIDEPMARVVALDAVAARCEDVRTLDGEMAGPQAPLAVDSIGACRRRCEEKRAGCNHRRSSAASCVLPHCGFLHLSASCQAG